MQQNQIIELLLFRFLQGEATPSEVAEIQKWVAADPTHAEVFTRLQDEASLKSDLKQLFQLMDGDVGQKRRQRMLAHISRQGGQKRKMLHVLRWIPYVAACLLIGVGIALFFLVRQPGKSKLMDGQQLAQSSKVKSGTNRAVLTTDDGSTIELRDDGEGLLTVDGDVVYSNGQQVMKDEDSGPKMLLLQTPRGGQYTVKLPDGTKVYLNAASSLRYPNYFEGSRRVVELEGEAYFEVSKGKIPFIVKSDLQEIEVLGTSFNVSAYVDDRHIETTLVEGKVKVHSHGKERFLAPGQQLIVTANISRTNFVDTELYTAWKDGAFSFADEPLERILARAARWYDVQIVFLDDRLKSKRFEGYVSRFSDMDVLLKTLELTGEVKFKFSNGIVYVSDT